MDPYLRHLIRSCVVVDPLRRIQSAGELCHRLDGWGDGRRILDRQREWKVTLASACVQAALVAAAAVIVFKLGFVVAATKEALAWHSFTPLYVTFSDATVRIYASMFMILEVMVMLLAGALLAPDAHAIKGELASATGEPTPEEGARWDSRIRAFAFSCIGHSLLIVLTYLPRRHPLVAEPCGARAASRRASPGSRRDALRAVLMSMLMLNYAGLLAGLIGLAA